MSNLSLVLFILAGGIFTVQVMMIIGWAAAVSHGASGSCPFWPLLIAIALGIAGVLTR